VKKNTSPLTKPQLAVLREVWQALGLQDGDRLLIDLRKGKFRMEPVRIMSPFEKFRGIGNPGIPSGRKAVVRYVRELRGG